MLAQLWRSVSRFDRLIFQEALHSSRLLQAAQSAPSMAGLATNLRHFASGPGLQLTSRYLGTLPAGSRMHQLRPALQAAWQQQWPAAALGLAPYPLHATPVRGYAKAPKGVVVPAEMQRTGSLRVNMMCSNLLAEPYKGTPPPLPWSSLVSAAGWRERWDRLIGKVKNTYALAKCTKHVPGFKVPAFKDEALLIYEKVCKALADGDLTELRKHVSPRVFTDMKREVAVRRDGGWARVHWRLAERPDAAQSRLCHARLLALDAKKLDNAFVQLTMHLVTRQSFAAYNKGEHLASGSPDKVLAVDDFWVFERHLQHKQGARWRVAGRLSIPTQPGQSVQLSKRPQPPQQAAEAG